LENLTGNIGKAVGGLADLADCRDVWVVDLGSATKLIKQAGEIERIDRGFPAGSLWPQE
jgi:hypothetical protein